MHPNRRTFLKNVGRGMLAASVGPALAADLFPGKLFADEVADRLTFGKLDPLVGLIQDAGPDKLLPLLVERLHDGADLKMLIAAAALANARTLGGEQYEGYHTMMALAPAYQMSQELPAERQALPVFKVLVRNATWIQNHGRQPDTLRPIKPADLPAGKSGTDALREAVEQKDKDAADRMFVALCRDGKQEDAFNQLLPSVQEELEVHRVVLPHRAWTLAGIIGMDYAQVLLRQSVHYCVQNLRGDFTSRTRPAAHTVLPKLLDQYKLIGKPAGAKAAEDGWVDQMSQTIFSSSPEVAADAVAAALAEGFAPDQIGEALSLAANQLVLRDNGRPKAVNDAKPAGSVHGDGIGVHASDSANAWRDMARYSDARNGVACLILGAYQCAFDRTERGGDFLKWEPYPRVEAREKIKTGDADALLAAAEDAIRHNDQAGACAAVARYGEEGHKPRPVIDLLLRYAISEDGALHAEKYYRTATEEFASLRPAFRWRQMVALARVTASEYGRPAPGYDEACHLLKV
ncbi:MAG TPA: hypothetical protein VMS17_20270 [Gemmataceae bacterium]|nr:hypothetical protein [Gemmataceae bacterium]